MQNQLTIQIILLPAERNQRSERINHIPCIPGDFDILDHTLKFSGKSMLYAPISSLNFRMNYLLRQYPSDYLYLGSAPSDGIISLVWGWRYGSVVVKSTYSSCKGHGFIS